MGIIDLTAKKRLPRAIWALGFVSLLMDVSSEMIHALLPAFLVGPLGASVFAVGLIEGVAEATALVVKLFSGTLSDRIGHRKWIAVAGYGLGALSKPLFPLAGSAALVFTARFVDRVGKGIRGAPRDALVADLAPPALLGAAFGLRQALDTVGAFAGPLIAIAIMAVSGGDFRLVFWIAVVPAMLAVAVLAIAVEEPQASVAPGQRGGFVPRLTDVKGLGLPFWRLVAVGAFLNLARFSEAFLLLRVQGLGLSVALLPLVLVMMNLVFGLVAYPLGALSDRKNSKLLLGVGFGVLAVADAILASAASLPAAFVGIAVWGLHMGMTQGLLASLIGKTAPPDRRGTAFGVFNLVGGASLLVGSALAGLLWDVVGPGASFLAGAGFATIGLVILVSVVPRAEPGRR
jgi:MFS family permease